MANWLSTQNHNFVYEGGYTEEKHGTCPADFADDIVDVPIAIIREGW